MTGAILVASGFGQHQKKPDPTQKLGILSAIQQLILTLTKSNIHPIVVITEQFEVSNLQKHIAKMGAICLSGDENCFEKLDFIKKGLSFLQPICDSVLIVPVNVPLLSSKTIISLLKSREDMISPSYNGKAGHPLLLSKKLFSSILNYNGKNGLRGALASLPCKRTFLEVDDEGVILNISKKPDFEKAKKLYKKRYETNATRALIHLRLAKETVFFGPGSAELLELIDTQKSVRMASSLMGISYTKAWNIIKKIESGSGLTVVNCKQGGKDGGKASLTKEAIELLKKYRLFEKRSNKAVQSIYEEIFLTGKEPLN